MCSVMHSPFLLSGGGQIHTAEPLVLYLTSSAPKMVDLRSIVGGRSIAIFDNDERRQEGDYSRSGRWLRRQGTDTRPRTFGA